MNDKLAAWKAAQQITEQEAACMTGLPAYGRDYRSAADVRADWAAGKDFQSALSNQYFSSRDHECFNEVWIRYALGRKIVRVQ